MDLKLPRDTVQLKTRKYVKKAFVTDIGRAGLLHSANDGTVLLKISKQIVWELKNYNRFSLKKEGQKHYCIDV